MKIPQETSRAFAVGLIHLAMGNNENPEKLAPVYNLFMALLKFTDSVDELVDIYKKILTECGLDIDIDSNITKH